MHENNLLRVLTSQFGFLAKSTGETLIAHHYTTYCVLKKLISYAPTIKKNEKERKRLLLAALTHDIGKKHPKNQEILRGRKAGKVVHKLSLKEYTSEIAPYQELLDLSQSEIKEVYDIIVTHHSISDADLDNIALEGAGFFTRLLMTADWLASMDRISFPTLNFLQTFFEHRVELTCFEFSRFPSPFTYLVLKTMNQSYMNMGWELLLSLDNGSVFIGSPGLTLPEKMTVVGDIYKFFLQRSLEYQKPNPRNFTKAMLSGLSELHPHMFLQAHYSSFMEMLSKKNEKPLVFFKFIKDTLEAGGELAKQRELFWSLDLLASASGTRGVPIIKERWKKRTRKQPPEKLNDIICDIFYSIKLDEILTEEYWPDNKGDTKLEGFKKEELFQILQSVTRKYDNLEMKGKKDLDIKEYLSILISMEEEIDFRHLAQETFERYKTYKITTNPEKGVCERCGSPISERMQPALGFAGGTSSSFSQIKAKYGDRATCGFCSFDNLTIRRDILGSRIPLYVKVQSKIPELINNNERLLSFIKEMRDGLRDVNDIEELKELPYMDYIPTPEDLPLPVGKSRRKDHDEPLYTESGLLIPIGTTQDYSSKDCQAQFEPLFQLLGLMGFKVAIGTEEQIGLFGQEVEVSTNAYLLSLAVIILASVVNKKKGRYIFAKDLLTKSSSAALMEIESAISDKKRKGKLRDKKEHFFLQCIWKSSLKITTMPNGGDYTMKDLLNHAKRLADRQAGIPHFCVEPEKRKEFLNPRNMTKHSTTVPISQALDELMRTGDTDMAFSRFLDKLARKIGEEESEQLNEFLGFVRKLLAEFKELRRHKIGDFIRTKNALMSAVFILTRYKKIKEVLND